uniref:C2H2-type domain-containing protein n=1 Tax=Trichogramma kaykai TaxID=54128 RepID=A0ABD2WQZ2_9HYME
MKSVHEGQKDHACDKCEKKFTQKPHLLVHQRTVHECRKDYACDMCENKFGQKSTLIKLFFFFFFFL